MSEEILISLLDFAQMDTDSIAELASRNLPAGVYVFEGTKVESKQEQPDDDGKAKPINVTFGFDVVEAKPIDKTIDPMTLVGRSAGENYRLWMNDFELLVGVLRGRYKKIGLPNTGNPGSVEGAPPGWLDTFVGHKFVARVSTSSRNGQEFVRYDWLRPAEEVAAS